MLREVREVWAIHQDLAQKHDIDAMEQIVILPVVVTITWAVADLALEVTEKATEKARETVDKRNPPPEISPIRAQDLLMPTEKPAAVRKAHWPPFWGHKHGLGGGC